MPAFFKLFQRIEEEEILPNSFYDTSITLKTKADKDYKRENYRQISLMSLDPKILNNIQAHQIQWHITQKHTPRSCWIYTWGRTV